MTRRAWGLLVLAFIMLCAAPFVRASTVSPTGGIGPVYSSGGVTIGDGAAFDKFLTRAVGGTTSPAGTALMENYRIGVGGADIAVGVARSIPWLAVANAAALAYAAGYTGFNTVGAPLALALGHSEFSIGATRCAATMTGWNCDPGVEAGPGGPPPGEFLVGTGNEYFKPGTQSPRVLGHGSSVAAACSSFAGQYAGNTAQDFCGGTITNVYTTVVVSSSQDSPTSGTCVVRQDRQENVGGPCGPSTTNFTGTPFNPGVTFDVNGGQPTGGCPATIDALNPAWSKPAGSPPDADGKCATGRYTTPTIETVADRIKAWGDPTKGSELTTDILAKGQPIAGASPRTVSGPATAVQPSTTSTTTDPTGTTTRTSTTTNHYNYAGDTITYNTTVTTITNNADGTTTTTSEDKPPEPGACEKDPTLLGCTKLGDPGNDKPVWKDKTIAYVPEDLGFGGGCPAPFVIPFGDKNVDFSFVPICDLAPMFKAFLLILVTLSCGILIVQQTTRT